MNVRAALATYAVDVLTTLGEMARDVWWVLSDAFGSLDKIDIACILGFWLACLMMMLGLMSLSGAW